MYLAVKAVHIFAVAMFLGNITLGLFWKHLADRTGNASIMVHTVRGLILADRIITIPGIILIVAAGLTLAGLAGIPILRTGWLVWSIALFIVSGIVFSPLSRVQRLLLETAGSGLQTSEETEHYKRLSSRWNMWGTIALALPLVAFLLMIFKPVLPAL